MKPLTYGFWYQALMKVAHRFNWHHMKPCYPMGETMLWCHWCGIRIVTKRVVYSANTLACTISMEAKP